MNAASKGRDDMLPEETGRPVSGVMSTGLTTDLWFHWDGPARAGLEVQLVTVNGTIAGAYPRVVTKGERLPIHRRFVPQSGSTTWYLRVRADSGQLEGLAITVEFRDRIGRTRALPICSGVPVRTDRVSAVEQALEIPEELLL
jgi:hypothetical protein